MQRKRNLSGSRWIGISATVILLAFGMLHVPGCGGGIPSRTDNPPDGDKPTEPSNYKGTIAGAVSDSRSTRESLDQADGEAMAQELPSDIDPSVVTVTFKDLDGKPLLNADGTPFPAASVSDAGEFRFDGLPVGIDFVVAVDLDGDGVVDIRQIVQIPADETGEAGNLEDINVDPLTTLIVAQLEEILAENGIDPDQLDISPTAIVHRIVDAFIHLFEETGIDQAITVDDIASLSAENVKALFEAILPLAVRTGMDTVEGNLRLGMAEELEGVIQAATEVFLRAGFPIADGPGGVDLSFLGELPDVEIMSIDMIHPPDDDMVAVAQLDEIGLTADQLDQLIADGTLDGLLGDGTVEDLLADGTLDELIADGTIDPGVLDGGDGTLFDEVIFDPGDDGFRPTVYVSTATEPDRNFSASGDFGDKEDEHRLPVIHEGLIRRIARLHLEKRVITLRNLYRVLTDAEVGLGVRLTYMVPTPEHDGPPPMVFESADGKGITRDVERIMFELFSEGFADPGKGFDDLEAEKDRIRQIMRDLLAGTVPPSMARMFGAILSERVENVDQIFTVIRKARAHLPFSRSGPAQFYVVADGDPFRPDAGEVNPVSVDIEFNEDGFPSSVVYNPSHTGSYYLAFSHDTETNNRVDVLVRETGRWMHGPRGGPVHANMGDETVFEPVNGVPFADFVSESGTFWPGISIEVANPEYRIGDETKDEFFGPTMQLFVLATVAGPEGVPVRVNFDVFTRTFTYDPNGRYYMMFTRESHDLGVFGLYDVELNFMASVHDLEADVFVEGPPPAPDEFLPPPDGTDAPPDGTIDPGTMDEPPPDGTDAPPDGTTAPGTTDAPPPDGTDAPPDGTAAPTTADEPPATQELPSTTTEPPPDDTTLPPLDGTQPPPDDTMVPPPDGTAPPPDGTEPPPPDGFEPLPEPEPFPMWEPALIAPVEVVGLEIQPEFFRFVYGIDVPNENYDASGNPYFDDVNGNGVEDPGEFTADFRPILFNPDDWRSTDIGRYYRTEDGAGVLMEEVDFESAEPRTYDGRLLVPRNLLPRLNVFKFGRPNSAINLLTTFLPPEFFDGAHSLNEDTRLGVFQAIAMVNLAMEQVFNVEAEIDFDGDGPFPPQRMLIDAFMFMLPIGDPLMLLLDGFEQLSELPTE